MFSVGEGLGSTTTIRLLCYVADEIEDVKLFDIDNGLNYLPTKRSNASIYHKDTTELPMSSMPNSQGDSSFDALLMSTALEKSDYLKVKSRSVLVMGDSAPTRKMECKALEATKSFRCDQSEDGIVAVEMVRRQLAAAAAESSPQTTSF